MSIGDEYVMKPLWSKKEEVKATEKEQLLVDNEAFIREVGKNHAKQN